MNLSPSHFVTSITHRYQKRGSICPHERERLCAIRAQSSRFCPIPGEYNMFARQGKAKADVVSAGRGERGEWEGEYTHVALLFTNGKIDPAERGKPWLGWGDPGGEVDKQTYLVNLAPRTHHLQILNGKRFGRHASSVHLCFKALLFFMFSRDISKDQPLTVSATFVAATLCPNVADAVLELCRAALLCCLVEASPRLVIALSTAACVWCTELPDTARVLRGVVALPLVLVCRTDLKAFVTAGVPVAISVRVHVALLCRIADLVGVVRCLAACLPCRRHVHTRATALFNVRPLQTPARRTGFTIVANGLAIAALLRRVVVHVAATAEVLGVVLGCASTVGATFELKVTGFASTAAVGAVVVERHILGTAVQVWVCCCPAFASTVDAFLRCNGA